MSFRKILVAIGLLAVAPLPVAAQLGVWCFPTPSAPCISLASYEFTVDDLPNPAGFRFAATLTGTISGLSELGEQHTFSFGLPLNINNGGLLASFIVSVPTFTAVGSTFEFVAQREQEFSFSSAIALGGPTDFSMSYGVGTAPTTVCFTNPSRATSAVAACTSATVPEPASASLAGLAVLILMIGFVRHRSGAPTPHEAVITR